MFHHTGSCTREPFAPPPSERLDMLGNRKGGGGGGGSRLAKVCRSVPTMGWGCHPQPRMAVPFLHLPSIAFANFRPWKSGGKVTMHYQGYRDNTPDFFVSSIVPPFRMVRCGCENYSDYLLSRWAKLLFRAANCPPVVCEDRVTLTTSSLPALS